MEGMLIVPFELFKVHSRLARLTTSARVGPMSSDDKMRGRSISARTLCEHPDALTLIYGTAVEKAGHTSQIRVIGETEDGEDRYTLVPRDSGSHSYGFQ